MAKIGGSSGESQSARDSGAPKPFLSPAGSGNKPVVSDPYASIGHALKQDGEAPGVSWFSGTRAVAQELSLAWFGQYQTMTLRDYLEAKQPDDQLAGLTLQWTSEGRLGHDLDAIRVIPDVLKGPEGFGELVPFDDSGLGQKVRHYLEQAGVIGTETSVLPTGGMLVDVGKTMGWYGPWGTEFGSRAFVRFEIRQNGDGEEWCCVYTNIAVATRYPLGYGRMVSEYFKVPWLLLSQLFIAETPFPSTIADMNRSVAYPDIPEHLWPRPFASVGSPGLVTFVTETGSSQDTIDETVAAFPSVIRAGFAVSDRAAVHLEPLLASVITAATHLATIAEDGFRNYRNPDYPASFDHTYGSEYVLFLDDPADEGRTVGGHARWVPETLLGDLVSATNKVADEARATTDPVTRDQLVTWIIREGAGKSVASTINFAFDSLWWPEQSWDDAHYGLDVAVDLDEINESTMALVNLGRMFIAQGEPGFAKERLVKALERADRFAEAQASYLLGTIAKAESQPELAQQYFARGAEAEGVGQMEFAEKCRGELEGFRG